MTDGVRFATARSFKLSVLPKLGTVRGIFTPVRMAEDFEDETAKFETLQEVMEERMIREQSILSSSPHKQVANAVKYARAMNTSLAMGLEKELKLVYSEFEQEFRRIIEMQNEILREYPEMFSAEVRGFTRKQFRRHLSETFELKRRAQELERTKTQLSLPVVGTSTGSGVRRSRIGTRGDVSRWASSSPWKHDGNVVYLPPI